MSLPTTSNPSLSSGCLLHRLRRWSGRLEAEAFLVYEVEELVLDDKTAEVDAKLIAIEGRLLEGNGFSAARQRWSV
jgi:hypothetical protein